MLQANVVIVENYYLDYPFIPSVISIHEVIHVVDVDLVVMEKVAHRR